MRFIATAILAAAATLAGCATPIDPAINEEAKRPLLCAAGLDCDAKWDAAQLWIVKNAGWKLQTSTTVVLQTFGPSTAVNDSLRIAVTVTREPEGPGQYRIKISARCGNPFGCTVEPMAAIADFKRYVNAVGTTVASR